MNVQIGDIAVVTHNHDVVVVLDYNKRATKYPYIYSSYLSGSRYKACESDFVAVIGKADMDKVQEIMAMSSKPQRKKANKYTDSDNLMADHMRGMRIGDQILLRIKGEHVPRKFLGWNTRAPSYPVMIEGLDGREMKCSPSMVVGKEEEDTTKRVEPEETASGISASVMNEVAEIYNGLSPENLTCDGELSDFQVRGKQRMLRKRLQDIFEEVGREITESEAFA